MNEQDCSPMEGQVLVLLARLVYAMERIADSMEAQAYEEGSQDDVPTHDLSGRPIR